MPRRVDTARLYELEDETKKALQQSADELKVVILRGGMSESLTDEQASDFSISEELFVTLDTFRPMSIQAATAFLRRYGYEVNRKKEDNKD
jgi:hypothetical protein